MKTKSDTGIPHPLSSSYRLICLSSLAKKQKPETKKYKTIQKCQRSLLAAAGCYLLSAITANNGFPDFRFPPAPGSGPFGDFYFVPSFCPRQSAVGSATAGNLSYDCARGRHLTVSAAASRRHVDASLDLFTRKSPRTWRDLSFIREESSLSARRLFFCGWWEYKLD